MIFLRALDDIAADTERLHEALLEDLERLDELDIPREDSNELLQAIIETSMFYRNYSLFYLSLWRFCFVSFFRFENCCKKKCLLQNFVFHIA